MGQTLLAKSEQNAPFCWVRCSSMRTITCLNMCIMLAHAQTHNHIPIALILQIPGTPNAQPRVFSPLNRTDASSNQMRNTARLVICCNVNGQKSYYKKCCTWCSTSNMAMMTVVLTKVLLCLCGVAAGHWIFLSAKVIIIAQGWPDCVFIYACALLMPYFELMPTPRSHERDTVGRWGGMADDVGGWMMMMSPQLATVDADAVRNSVITEW